MFKDKVVVITGSTQGIGKRTAELLAARGAKIVINSRSEERVNSVCAEMRQKGFDVIGVYGNVADYSFCLSLRDTVIQEFGKVDYLINNAGLAAKGTLANSSSDVFKHVFDVNVLGSLYPTKVFLNDIINTKGGVLFISSLAGIIGLPSYIAYSATKRSIVGIAESLKNELVSDGVYVGVNYPGFTENDPNKKIVSTSGLEKTLPKRNDVRVGSLDNTASNIIRQIERRKFRSYSSFSGLILQTTYRLFPRFSIFMLKLNRNKIIQMD